MSGNICAATNSPSPCSRVTTTSSTNPAPRGASSPTTPNVSHQSHPEPGRRSILEAVGIIHHTLDRHLHPHTMRPETESLEGLGESLAKARRCNGRVAFCLLCLTGK